MNPISDVINKNAKSVTEAGTRDKKRYCSAANIVIINNKTFASNLLMFSPIGRTAPTGFKFLLLQILREVCQAYMTS